MTSQQIKNFISAMQVAKRTAVVTSSDGVKVSAVTLNGQAVSEADLNYFSRQYGFPIEAVVSEEEVLTDEPIF